MTINKGAASIAALHFPQLGAIVEAGPLVELRKGWFFSCARLHSPIAGSHGVVVNKHSGAVFVLGSAFPGERDLELYDRGYR